MADPNLWWIYIIIFMAIPIARIIPRLLAKKGIGKKFPQSAATEQQQQQQFEPSFDEYSSQKPRIETTAKPPTKENLVLGALDRGSKTFESIQKNTGLNNQELDSVLKDLEKNGMLKVIHKQGLLGQKTELYPTDKGFKEYYS